MSNLQTHIKQAGIRKFAAHIGIRYQSVQDWLRTGRVPAERVIAVEAATGISRHELRPDVFGPPPDQQAARHEH